MLFLFPIHFIELLLVTGGAAIIVGLWLKVYVITAFAIAVPKLRNFALPCALI